MTVNLDEVSHLLRDGDLAAAAAEMGCVKPVQRPGKSPSLKVDYKEMARILASLATGEDVPLKPPLRGRKKSKSLKSGVAVTSAGADIPASLLPVAEGTYLCRRVSSRTVGDEIRVTLAFQPWSQDLQGG